MNVILFTILTLVALGVLAAVILYFVAQKFKVYEDPRIDEVEAILPGANCGGCGYPGCRGLAEALVKEDDISALYCPVGGAETMKAAADHLGKSAPEKDPEVAVVRCNGTCANRARTTVFDGASSCAVVAATYGGETGCTFGCLGRGDCTVVCNFDAIHMNLQTGLPEVDEEKCTACGACVKACPKILIELRKKGPKGRRVFVSCQSKDKGGVARKACSVACIGCGKCVKVCPFEAITLENNLAYIDFNKCRLCRKCVPECPTGAIHETNFPPAKPKVEKPAAETKPATEEKSVVEAKPATEKPAKAPKIEAQPVEPAIQAQTKPATSLIEERPEIVASHVAELPDEPVVLDKEQIVDEAVTGQKPVDEVKTETAAVQEAENKTDNA